MLYAAVHALHTNGIAKYNADFVQKGKPACFRGWRHRRLHLDAHTCTILNIECAAGGSPFRKTIADLYQSAMQQQAGSSNSNSFVCLAKRRQHSTLRHLIWMCMPFLCALPSAGIQDCSCCLVLTLRFLLP